jgi:hypothetical protein
MPSVSGERLTASLFHVAVRKRPTNETDQASCLSSVSRSWSRVPPPHLRRDLLRLFSRGPVSFPVLGHSGRPPDNGVYAAICPRMRPAQRIDHDLSQSLFRPRRRRRSDSGRPVWPCGRQASSPVRSLVSALVRDHDHDRRH